MKADRMAITMKIFAKYIIYLKGLFNTEEYITYMEVKSKKVKMLEIESLIFCIYFYLNCFFAVFLSYEGCYYY